MDISLTQKLALDIREVRLLTGMGRDAIYEAVRAGKLKGKKRGKSTLFLADDVRAWLRALPDLDLSGSSEAPVAQMDAAPPRRRLMVAAR